NSGVIACKNISGAATGKDNLRQIMADLQLALVLIVGITAICIAWGLYVARTVYQIDLLSRNDGSPPFSPELFLAMAIPATVVVPPLIYFKGKKARDSAF